MSRGCYEDATRKLLPWNFSFTSPTVRVISRRGPADTVTAAAAAVSFADLAGVFRRLATFVCSIVGDVNVQLDGALTRQPSSLSNSQQSASTLVLGSVLGAGKPPRCVTN